jgi:hypothetical protein
LLDNRMADKFRTLPARQNSGGGSPTKDRLIKAI